VTSAESWQQIVVMLMDRINFRSWKNSVIDSPICDSAASL
jgi:hypothetical protein